MDFFGRSPTRFDVSATSAAPESAPPARIRAIARQAAKRRKDRATFTDAMIGLAVRAGLVSILWTWARSNALPADQWTDWQSWVAPQQGFIGAVETWLPGFLSPEYSAWLILVVVMLITVSVALGFLARLSGLAMVLLSIGYAVFILPPAWPSALVYGALGFYLMLRGAGPVSIDHALARLSRMT